jgi:hypothetical protein
MQLRHLSKRAAFWDSPVPYAVRQQLNQALPHGRPCSEPNVWLVQALPGVQQESTSLQLHIARISAWTCTDSPVHLGPELC